MKKILLIEDNKQIADVYNLKLLTYVDLEVANALDKNSALENLKKNQFELIICRAVMGPIKVAIEISDHLKSNKINIPMIVIGEGAVPAPVAGVVAGSMELKFVIKSAAQALGISASDMAKKDVGEYFPIKSVFFTSVNFPEVDIYQKTNDGYVLVFKKNEKVNHESAKDDYLYVKKLDRLKMVNQISAEMMMKIDLDKLNPTEEIQVIEATIEMIQKKMLTIGFNEETIAQAEKSLKAITNTCKKNPKLGLLLSRLSNNKSSYHYKHIQITTYVALHLLKRLEWGKSTEQEEKMAFVCLFHDIALENDQQAAIDSAEELLKSGVNFRENEIILKHAQVAADLVAKYPNAPHGAEQIIKQHHGVLNGLGFSDQFAANIVPMAVVFIIAEGFTKIAMRQAAGPYNRDEMVAELKSKYQSLKVKKMVDLLETIVI